MRSFATLALLLAGCPAGKAADTVKSAPPKVGDADPAMAAPKVEACPTPAPADLMAVDWTPELRGDFEVAMKEGLALVSYDCKSIKLVPSCSLPGEYGYIGTTRREKTVAMNNKDEVAANLPVGGISWLSDLGGSFGRETALAAHFVMVGKQSSAKKQATRAELTGTCVGATHFVRASTVGAFVVASGSKANIAASVKVLGKGAGGASASETQLKNQDGSVDACQASKTDDKKPPEQCGAVVRIELEPIGGEKPAEVPTPSCPPGMFMADGACRAPDVPHQCKLGDGADCEKQCSAGDAGSCATLALMYRDGLGVDKDAAKSAAAAQQACDKEDAAGCRLLGGAKLAAKDPASALALLDKACLAGDGKACVDLGLAQLADKKQAGNAQYSFRRACYGGGEFEGCTQLGMLYVEGKGGMNKSPKLAAKFFEKACKEGSEAACAKLKK